MTLIVSQVIKSRTVFTQWIFCICVMSVIPPSVYITRKVRQNEEKLKNYEAWNLHPTKYSSKYMNSIWGMYNRYSVHNLKKNMDKDVFNLNIQQQENGAKQVADKPTDLRGSLRSAKTFLSPGFL